MSSPDVSILAQWRFLMLTLLAVVPFGLVLARAVAGKDVRNEGSGNIGATNVARVAGRRAGVRSGCN